MGSNKVDGIASPFRIERAGGWYHVTARGNERKVLFRDDRDRRHLLELLAEMEGQPEWLECEAMIAFGGVLECSCFEAQLTGGIVLRKHPRLFL